MVMSEHQDMNVVSWVRLVGSVVVSAALLAACGGGGTPSSPSSGSGGGTSGGTGGGTTGGGTGGTTITITSAGASPLELTVPAGSRVTFANNDSRPHDMVSDPHPEHTDCPPLNDVGFLNPGQSRATGNLVTPRTCGFHDHNLDTVASLRGRIIVQ